MNGAPGLTTIEQGRYERSSWHRYERSDRTLFVVTCLVVYDLRRPATCGGRGGRRSRRASVRIKRTRTDGRDAVDANAMQMGLDAKQEAGKVGVLKRMGFSMV